MCCSPWGRKEPDTTELNFPLSIHTHTHQHVTKVLLLLSLCGCESCTKIVILNNHTETGRNSRSHWNYNGDRLYLVTNPKHYHRIPKTSLMN